MFALAFLQDLGSGRLRIEERMLKSEFERRGIPVELYSIKKPSARRKNFTGRVFESPGDFAYVGAVSRRQEVWCSEVVEWKSEYRAYVIDDEIVGVDHYAGEAGFGLDIDVVKAALAAYRESGQAPAAYGIDFGVLESGQTALVEANDGYALGAYTIDAKPYTDLLIRRWQELLTTSAKA